jgi:chemotaxis protein methyltransferase CheR
MAVLIKFEQDFDSFVQMLKQKNGIDLNLYKQDQMKRRLISFRNRNGFAAFVDLFRAMARDEALYSSFLDQMTINVTEFFRNSSRWDVLSQKIVPELLTRSRKLKCWSAACSTGEEPYSLAMLLSKKIPFQDFSILATDIDQTVLSMAIKGVYRNTNGIPLANMDEIDQVEGSFVVSSRLRKSVNFKKHNLLADPYDSGFDLIVCRNVLIYFTDSAKEEIYTKFSKSLKKGGYLFVGGTEQIFNPDKYGLENVVAFFYRRK